jgi:HEAT repeat protein
MGRYFLFRLKMVGLVFLIVFVIPTVFMVFVTFVGNGFRLPLNPPPPPPTTEQLLAELRNPDMFRRMNAIDAARRSRTVDRRAVAEALKEMVTDPSLALREKAIAALPDFGGPEDAPALVKAMDSDWGTTRWAAYDALARLKGPAAAEALAGRLKNGGGERMYVRNALKALGPDAEPFVRPYLDDANWTLRVEACEVLAAVGTHDSVPALQKAAADANPNVSGAAQSALRAVARR